MGAKKPMLIVVEVAWDSRANSSTISMGFFAPCKEEDIAGPVFGLVF
jgi:hypothetical protein